VLPYIVDPLAERAMVSGASISPGRIGGRFGRWIGLALLIHFVVVITVANVVRHAPAEMVWISHVSLLVAGLGLVLNSTLLVAAALTAVGVLHGLWLIDSLSGLLFGWFPLGGTRYLLVADPWTRAATAHHFYLAPLLFVILWRHRAYPWTAWPLASGLFLVLSLLSRASGSPALNVNWAFRVGAVEDWWLVVAINSLSTVSYLVVLNAGAAVVLFLPVALLMRWRVRGAGGPVRASAGTVQASRLLIP